MNLRQLEAFRATMRTGSITGAADALHISQPSVSRLIADLERTVGFALFLRAGRGLAATVEARRFHEAVEGMFLGIDRLQELAEAIRTTAGGVVSLGVIPSLSMAEVPGAVAELHRRRGDVRFMLSVRNTPAIVDAVQMRQFDLGVVGRQPPYGGVETLYQTRFPYLCLMPEDHRLVGGEGPVDLEELAETETFITFGGAFPDAMLGIDASLSARLQRRSRLSAQNMPAAAALVRETGALAIVDPFTASVAAMQGGVVNRPVRQRLSYHVAIVAASQESLSREARELAALIEARLERVRTRLGA